MKPTEEDIEIDEMGAGWRVALWPNTEEEAKQLKQQILSDLEKAEKWDNRVKLLDKLSKGYDDETRTINKLLAKYQEVLETQEKHIKNSTNLIHALERENKQLKELLATKEKVK